MGCPAWHSVVLQAEDCLKQDDDGYGQFARNAARAVCARCEGDEAIAATAPDPALFRLFLAALALWASRPDLVERERASGVVQSIANALNGVSRRERPMHPMRRTALEMGLPPRDRD